MNQTIRSLALENLRVGATLNTFAKAATLDSFCCGLMAHLAELHRENAASLNAGIPSLQETELLQQSLESPPNQTATAVERCRKLQWDLLMQYRTALKGTENMPTSERSQLETQFRDLQQLAAGFEYNASIIST